MGNPEKSTGHVAKPRFFEPFHTRRPFPLEVSAGLAQIVQAYDKRGKVDGFAFGKAELVR